MTKADAGRAIDAAIEAIHAKRTVFGGRTEKAENDVWRKGQICK
jgi:hypothetical protein